MDMTVLTPLLVRNRRGYVESDAALWKYSVNSRTNINILKENISHVHNIWTKWTQSSKSQWLKFSRSFSASCFSLAVTFYRSRRIYLCLKNETRASSFWSSHIRTRHLHSLFACSFSQHSQHFISETSAVSSLWKLVFIDFLLRIFWPSKPEVLGLFTLSISPLFDFITSLLLTRFLDTKTLFRDKIESCYFFQLNIFLGIFGTGLIFFKSLDQLISSGEVSEVRILLRVPNEVSAETGKTFWWLVTEVQGTQTRAILEDAVSLEVIV